MQRDHLTTNEFAASMGVKGDSVRRRLCVTGHYLGIRPIKLPNGRLLWPEDERQRVLRGEKPASAARRA